MGETVCVYEFGLKLKMGKRADDNRQKTEAAAAAKKIRYLLAVVECESVCTQHTHIVRAQYASTDDMRSIQSTFVWNKDYGSTIVHPMNFN